MIARHPCSQKDAWSERLIPGSHAGAATPSDGKAVVSRNTRMLRRTNGADCKLPTKPMKSPRSG